MFAPGTPPPLYQQAGDPLLAYTKAIALSTAGIGYRALYTCQTVPLVAGISWGLVDLWRNANELVQFGNPTFGYWNNVIPYISLTAAQYFYGPVATSCFYQGGNTFCAWVRFHGLTTGTRWLASINNMPAMSWAFGIANTVAPSFVFSVSAGMGVFSWGPALPLGYVMTDWHFYAMVYNQGTITLWIDSYRINLINPAIPWPPAATASTFRLGWQGDCDMILPLWIGSNYTWTDSMIRAYYMATRPMFGQVT